jgi:anhydro-N-acetylmuramic acid kinase
VEHSAQQCLWDVSVGDAQFVSSALRTPVLTNFIRHASYADRRADLPAAFGFCRIGRQMGEEVCAFLNLGLMAHITIVDCVGSRVLLDSDTGPGTFLMNRLARQQGAEHGFDRDGSQAAAGTVDNNCLDTLASLPCFQTAEAARLEPGGFVEALEAPCLEALSPADRVSTITALTARAAFDFQKRVYRQGMQPTTVWVSGGGAHNQALMDYLGVQFDPTRVASVEQAGIAPSRPRRGSTAGTSRKRTRTGPGGAWQRWCCRRKGPGRGSIRGGLDTP